MKDKIINFLKSNLFLKDLDLEKLLEVPKKSNNGDYSLPLFILANKLNSNLNPVELAKEIEKSLSENLPIFIDKVLAIGPFLNFYINKKFQVEEVFNLILSGNIFDINKSLKKEKILLEYPSPNSNKSLHLGHVRNILIGNSLFKVLSKVGNKVIRVSINNDRGIAICKSMLGYKLFYSGDSPESLKLKSDQFISNCYVKFEAESKLDPSLDKLAQELLVKWEEGDLETIKLWKKVMGFVFNGYDETYKKFKLLKFDKVYFESQIYKKGKDIVLNALKKNIDGFEKEKDGAIFCDLTKEGFDKKYLLRGDGTSLYMTQDLYLAKLKDKDFKADKYIFIVGRDQEYHFKVLFEILDRLGFGGVTKNYHFSYGYVYNESGKKFSSRKGEVIGADWLYDEVVSKAKKNLLEKEISKNLNEVELNRRAKIIGYSGIAFSFLKINPLDDIKFDVSASLSFQGETGPYVQYTFARIVSLLKKGNFDFNFGDIDLVNVSSIKKNIKKISKLNFNSFGDKEFLISKTLAEFPDYFFEAVSKYKLSSIANFLIKLSQNFNDFYQNSNILKSSKDDREAKLFLSYLTAIIIKEGLNLLDIEVLDEM